MEVLSKPKVVRFAQTQPGDLFMYAFGAGLFVAMTVTDPANDGDRAIVVLGPELPQGMAHPSLVTPSATTVVSFGKDYKLRLPCHAGGWMTKEPPDDVNCIVVTDEGGIFFRANFGGLEEFRACYIDMEKGEIKTDKSARSYIGPSRLCAFAVEWELLTVETEARPILSYPHQQSRKKD